MRGVLDRAALERRELRERPRRVVLAAVDSRARAGARLPRLARRRARVVFAKASARGAPGLGRAAREPAPDHPAQRRAVVQEAQPRRRLGASRDGRLPREARDALRAARGAPKRPRQGARAHRQPDRSVPATRRGGEPGAHRRGVRREGGGARPPRRVRAEGDEERRRDRRPSRGKSRRRRRRGGGGDGSLLDAERGMVARHPRRASPGERDGAPERGPTTKGRRRVRGPGAGGVARGGASASRRGARAREGAAVRGGLAETEVRAGTRWGSCCSGSRAAPRRRCSRPCSTRRGSGSSASSRSDGASEARGGREGRREGGADCSPTGHENNDHQSKKNGRWSPRITRIRSKKSRRRVILHELMMAPRVQPGFLTRSSSPRVRVGIGFENDGDARALLGAGPRG